LLQLLQFIPNYRDLYSGVSGGITKNLRDNIELVTKMFMPDPIKTRISLRRTLTAATLLVASMPCYAAGPPAAKAAKPASSAKSPLSIESAWALYTPPWLIEKAIAPLAPAKFFNILSIIFLTVLRPLVVKQL